MKQAQANFTFELHEAKDNLISELFGVGKERADVLHKHFSEVLKSEFADNQHKFNTCNLIKGFTAAAKNDYEAHYAIYQAGAKSQEMSDGPSLGKGLSALIHVLSHH